MCLPIKDARAAFVHARVDAGACARAHNRNNEDSDHNNNTERRAPIVRGHRPLKLVLIILIIITAQRLCAAISA